MFRGMIGIVAAGGLALTGLAAAAPSAAPTPISELLACRTVTDPAAQLKCFREKADIVAKAQEQDDLVVMNRAEVRQARRSIFGMAMPTIDIFNSHDKPAAKHVEEEGLDRITDTIKLATQDGYRRWIITLSDGARWAQVDDERVVTDPRPGMAIVIRRAAMGSYLASIDGQRSIRVHRIP